MHSKKFLELISGCGLIYLSEFADLTKTTTLEQFCTTDVEKYYPDAEGFTEADRECLKASRLFFNSPEYLNIKKELIAHTEEELREFNLAVSTAQ